MRTSGRRALTAFVATAAVGLFGYAGTATATPSVSPGVKRTFVGANPNLACRYGYLCAYVRGDGGYYRFDFTRCNTRYRVSGWHGRGYVANSQWGGVIARFYTRSGGLYTTRQARRTSLINWEPVWSLRVC